MSRGKQASLLLDIDNTLVDRDGAFRHYIQVFIQENGQDSRSAFGRLEESELLEKILALDGHGKKERSQFCRELLQCFPRLPFSVETLWQDHQRLPEFVCPDPARIELLQRLATHYQLLLLSNGSGAMQRRKLRQAQLTPFFQHKCISGEVGFAKPDQRFFLHALQKCRHAQVVMIGDDYRNDMLPAMALDLKTIFINPRKEVVPIKPDREIASIEALEETLTCLI